MVSSRFTNLEDFRVQARKTLPRIVFDYIDGGVDSEIGLRRNREAFEAHRLLPRYLVDVRARNQSVTLLGRTYASPFGISPAGLAGLFRPGADLMLAAAARQMNVPFVLSTVSNETLEDVARIAPDHLWFQLYATPDDTVTRDLIRRAQQAGISTLVFSIDVPINSNRERNRRNGFSHPLRMPPAVMLEALRHPGWLWRYFRAGGIPDRVNLAPYKPEGATAFEAAAHYSKLIPSAMHTWETFEKVRHWWQGPLVVKGILHPEDAVRAADLGAQGAIVSNHGGRQLDLAPAAVEMLPAIQAAVGDRLELILDSGIRRGSDVVIAKCLGARAAFFARPTLYAAAVGGQAAIESALGTLRNEVDLTLAQLGCPDFEALGRAHLARP